MLPICPGCGVVAPTSRASCNVCGSAFAAPPLIATGRGHGGEILASVHAADFACKACGIRSPCATVDVTGQIECMGCGLRQAFDIVQWSDALAFSHGVGDLSGPALDPISARSRHAKLGTAFTSSTKTQNGMIMDAAGTRHHTLKTTVSPGHPVCLGCHVPLDVWLEGPTTKTRCPRCHDAAAYGLPEGAARAYAPLRGVIANEQRVDRPVAKLGRTTAGVESIVCPQCGAGISAGGGAELAKCTYCNLAVRIPGTLARQQRRGALPKMDAFWLVLEGPSNGRQRLAMGRSEDPDDGDDEEAPPAMPPAQWQAAPPGPAPPSGGGVKLALIIIAAIALVLVIGAGVAVYLLTADAGAPHPKGSPPRPAPSTKRN